MAPNRHVQLLAPIGGINRAASYPMQLPFTAPELVNVYPTESSQLHSGVAPRPGLGPAFYEPTRIFPCEYPWTNQPVRMLSQLSVVTPTATGYPSVWREDFLSGEFELVWTDWGAVPPLLLDIQDHFAYATNSVGRAKAHSAIATMNSAAGKTQQYDIWITPDDLLWRGAYTIAACLENATPGRDTGAFGRPDHGILLTLHQFGQLGTYEVYLNCYNGAAVTTFTKRGCFGQVQPGWLSLRIVQNSVTGNWDAYAYWLGQLVLGITPWVNNTAYALGDWVVPTQTLAPDTLWYYECTVAGTSDPFAANEPNWWNYVEGDTIPGDGTVTWTVRRHPITPALTPASVTGKATAVPVNANRHAFGASVDPTPVAWAPGIPKFIGECVIPTVANGYLYEVTIVHNAAGVRDNTGAVEPVWPTVIGATILDGWVTWTCRAPTTDKRAIVDHVRVTYYATGTEEQTRTLLCASGEGEFFVEDHFHQLRQVRSCHRLAADRPFRAVEYEQKLYIADYGDLVVAAEALCSVTAAAGGTTTVQRPAAAAWSTDIIPGEHIAIVSDSSNAALFPNGTYEILRITTAPSPENMFLAPERAGSVGVTFTVEFQRSPKVYDPFGTDNATEWTALTAYSVGDLVRPSGVIPNGRGLIYRCVYDGVATAPEPVWPTTLGDTITEGGGSTIYWRCEGQDMFGTLDHWLATEATIPVGCPIVARWYDGILLGGNSESPNIYHGSRMGDPLDWDFSAFEYDDPGRAWVSQPSESGTVAQPIKALIPGPNGILYVATKNQIWVLTAPPNIGGQMVIFNERAGILGNFAWCFGEAGEVFYLAHNGLWSTQRGYLQGQTVPNELQLVNTSMYTPFLAYDGSRGGVLVLLGANEPRRLAQWFVYVQGNVSYWKLDVQGRMLPTAILDYVASDPAESGVLVGSFSGVIHRFDRHYEHDYDWGGNNYRTMTSYYWYGPFRLSDHPSFEAVLNSILAVLGRESGFVKWSVHTGASAEQVIRSTLTEAPLVSGFFTDTGVNPTHTVRLRGAWAIVSVGRGNPTGLDEDWQYNRRWLVEEMTATVESAGYRRR